MRLILPRPQLCAISVAFEAHEEIVPTLGRTNNGVAFEPFLPETSLPEPFCENLSGWVSPYVNSFSSTAISFVDSGETTWMKCTNSALTALIVLTDGCRDLRVSSSFSNLKGDNADEPRKVSNERGMADGRVMAGEMKEQLSAGLALEPDGGPQTKLNPNYTGLAAGWSLNGCPNCRYVQRRRTRTARKSSAFILPRQRGKVRGQSFLIRPSPGKRYGTVANHGITNAPSATSPCRIAALLH